MIPEPINLPEAEFTNQHCSVVGINGRGVMIRGASGTGKSSLAMGLLDTGRSRGFDVQLVCDDQALLSVHDQRLVAEAPQAIRGQIEIRGFGIANIPCIDKIEISLVCDLAEDRLVERMPDKKTTEIMDIALDLLTLPKRHEQQAVRIVLAYFEKNMQ